MMFSVDMVNGHGQWSWWASIYISGDIGTWHSVFMFPSMMSTKCFHLKNKQKKPIYFSVIESQNMLNVPDH